MNEYDLINSKAISEHCKNIRHKFNIEELAVLIYRSKQIDIVEKIHTYDELINNYEDISMIKHLHCGPYNSVKECIKQEIDRLNDVYSNLKTSNEDSYYQLGAHYVSSGRFDNSSRVYRTYEDVIKAVTEEIEEDNDISRFRIIKKSFSTEDDITAEFYVKNQELKLVYIYDSNNSYPDFASIFVNLPTPFKKGDLLYSNSNTPFWNGFIPSYNNVFCLNWMITWEDDFENKLLKGCLDDSDMIGSGYYIFEDDLVQEHCYEYDNWEFYDGKLTDMERILKGVSDLIQDKIEIDLFLQAYNVMRQESIKNHLEMYTDEGLMLAGFNEEDIKNSKGGLK